MANRILIDDQTLIRQITTNDVSFSNGTLNLQQRWKGRFEYCRTVLGMLTTAVDPNYAYFVSCAGTLVSAFSDPPFTPNGYIWKFSSGTVDETEGGEHGFLNLTWVCVLESIDGASGLPDNAWTETFSLDWQPETYDPYAYCANPLSHSNEDTGPSQRSAIEKCLNPPAALNNLTDSGKIVSTYGKVVDLNQHEKNIMKKKLEGKVVVKHHPVITHVRTAYDITKRQLDTILSSSSPRYVAEPDQILYPPYDFHLTGYEFVCQGTRVQAVKPDIKSENYNVTYTTPYEGAISVDLDFYGQNAWQFGTY